MEEDQLKEKLIDIYMTIFGTDYFEIFCKICFVILVALLMYSFLGSATFRITHLFPKATKIVNVLPDIKSEPVQINLHPQINKNIIGDRGNKYTLIYLADYSISGLAAATNTNFWLRGSMRSNFDEVALYDIGLVWGDLANKDLFKKYDIRFKSVKTLSSGRQLQPRINKYNRSFPMTMDYFQSHLAHTHVIPSNDNIMSALLKIKNFDAVKLDGYLVDIMDSNNKIFAHTSLSRQDTDQTSRGYNRGGGACEIMYVTSVQIGKNLYK